MVHRVAGGLLQLPAHEALCSSTCASLRAAMSFFHRADPVVPFHVLPEALLCSKQPARRASRRSTGCEHPGALDVAQGALLATAVGGILVQPVGLALLVDDSFTGPKGTP